jgi:hypothetical protein
MSVMGDVMRTLFLLAPLAFFSATAHAHHLDDYDARIRAEAHLPAEWFACRVTKDCALVPVPCQSGLAINAQHVDEAREALVQAIPFCLGSSLDDTEAVCERSQCATKGGGN